jgi:hypothetical protein
VSAARINSASGIDDHRKYDSREASECSQSDVHRRDQPRRSIRNRIRRHQERRITPRLLQIRTTAARIGNKLQIRLQLGGPAGRRNALRARLPSTPLASAACLPVMAR